MAAADSRRKRLDALRAEIDRHNYLYYVKDSPQISDAAYDELFRELESIEREHPEWITADSPPQRVGATPLSQLAQVTHRVPMLSLNNGFADADVESFDRRVCEGLDAETVE